MKELGSWGNEYATHAQKVRTIQQRCYHPTRAVECGGRHRMCKSGQRPRGYHDGVHPESARNDRKTPSNRAWNKRALLWPFVMAACLLAIATILVISYAYFGFLVDRVQEKMQAPDFDAEQRSFMPLLLKKQVGKQMLAEVIAAQDYQTAKREINEFLFVRFDRDVEWNLYVDGKEVVNNQLTGFIAGRRFLAYIPSVKPLKVELEINAKVWDKDDEIPHAFRVSP